MGLILTDWIRGILTLLLRQLIQLMSSDIVHGSTQLVESPSPGLHRRHHLPVQHTACS